MSRRQNLYVGRAGQMAVMAEFLWRGWNVAFPEVDVGDDAFVVRDSTGEFWRIQVKTATAQRQGRGYAAQFSVPLGQLETPRDPDLVYFFATRSSSGWEPFVIMGREALLNEHVSHQVGSPFQGSLLLRFSYGDSELRCSDRDFSAYHNDWSRWPVIAN